MRDSLEYTWIIWWFKCIDIWFICPDTASSDIFSRSKYKLNIGNLIAVLVFEICPIFITCLVRFRVCCAWIKDSPLEAGLAYVEEIKI